MCSPLIIFDIFQGNLIHMFLTRLYLNHKLILFEDGLEVWQLLVTSKVPIFPGSPLRNRKSRCQRAHIENRYISSSEPLILNTQPQFGKGCFLHVSCLLTSEACQLLILSRCNYELSCHCGLVNSFHTLSILPRLLVFKYP